MIAPQQHFGKDRAIGYDLQMKSPTHVFFYLYPPNPQSMSAQNRFSDKDQQRIKDAVKQAEGNISGEIVPVFVEQSGYYTLANYRGALMGGLFAFICIIIFDRLVPDLAVYDPVYILVIVIFGCILGASLPQFIIPLKRVLVGQKHFNRATKNRAENAFLEEEVFNTRHRTGIMIFISFFEREVIVMADRGISKVVDQKEWDNIVNMITTSINQGRLTDGIIVAIKRCGEILHEKGFDKTPDDVNELRDDLRFD